MRRLAGLVVLYTAVTVAWTWPLAAHLGNAFVIAGPEPSPLVRADLNLTSWIVSWGAHQLRRDPLRLFEANFFYPLPHALAFSEHMVAGALLVLPLDVLHHDPVLNHNLLLLASFALGATGTALLIRDLGGSLPAALTGGTLFAFGPLRQAQLGHLHALCTHWMPFTLLFLHRLLESGRWRPGIAFAACLLLAGLSSVYHLYYFGIAVALFLGFHAVWRCPTAPHAYRRALGLGLLVWAAVLPTMIPYALLRRQFALGRGPQQAIEFSAVGEHYLGALLAPHRILERRFFQGLVESPILGAGTVILTLLGVWRGARGERAARRLTGVYLAAALALAVLSLGPVMRMHVKPHTGLPGPHAWLARVIPGFDGLRVPQRAAAEVLLLISVLAGLGAGALLGGARPARWLGAGMLVAVLVVECWRPPLGLVPAPTSPLPAAYAWLAAQPGDVAVVELPIGPFEQESRYMLWSTYHWKRLVNGYSGSFPARAYLRDVVSGFPNPAALRLLLELHVRYVIVHPRAVRGGQRAVCMQPEPYLAVRYRDAEDCVLEVLGAPAAPTRPPDRLLSLAGVRLTTSSGDDPAAVADGDRETHWVQPVEGQAAGWLQIDLPGPHPLTRLVIRLGGHFGEYPRNYALATSDDGVAWLTAVTQTMGVPPLAGLLNDPHDLATEIPLNGIPIQHLRLVRAPPTEDDWGWWGIHELELYERVTAPAPGSG